MGAGRTLRRYRVFLAATTAALFAAPALAAQYPPRRAELFAPPAIVALTGLELAATRAPVDPAFSVPDAAPAAALLDAALRAQPREPDALDLAWSLMAPENRDLALALELMGERIGAGAGAPPHPLRPGRRLRRPRVCALLDRSRTMARLGRAGARAPRGQQATTDSIFAPMSRPPPTGRRRRRRTIWRCRNRSPPTRCRRAAGASSPSASRGSSARGPLCPIPRRRWRKSRARASARARRCKLIIPRITAISSCGTSSSSCGRSAPPRPLPTSASPRLSTRGAERRAAAREQVKTAPRRRARQGVDLAH